MRQCVSIFRNRIGFYVRQDADGFSLQSYGRRGSDGHGSERQREVKLRAGAQFALNPYAPPVCVYDVLDDGQAKSRATRFSRASLVDPIEALKDAIEVFRSNAGAEILHGELHF